MFREKLISTLLIIAQQYEQIILGMSSPPLDLQQFSNSFSPEDFSKLQHFVDSLDHDLFTTLLIVGNGGIGKTTLSNIIASYFPSKVVIYNEFDVTESTYNSYVHVIKSSCNRSNILCSLNNNFITLAESNNDVGLLRRITTINMF